MVEEGAPLTNVRLNGMLEQEDKLEKEMERSIFLEGVRRYIERDPDAAAYVADFVQAGLRAKLNEAYERAADMEVALAVLATKRYKGADALVLSKLEKWEGKTALSWDWLKMPSNAEIVRRQTPPENGD